MANNSPWPALIGVGLVGLVGKAVYDSGRHSGSQDGFEAGYQAKAAEDAFVIHQLRQELAEVRAVQASLQQEYGRVTEKNGILQGLLERQQLSPEAKAILQDIRKSMHRIELRATHALPAIFERNSHDSDLNAN